MADKKVSELDAIAGSATAADDLFLIVDASGSVTKKITRAELNNAIEQDVLSTVDINGGTIDSTVIGGATPAAGDFTTVDTTGNVTVGGNLTASSDFVTSGTFGALYKSSDSQILYIAGGNTNASGGNIRLYGGTHSTDASDILLRRGSISVAKLDGGTGDISFYADNGTTQALFFDASTQRLGLGTTSPVVPIQVKASSPAVSLQASASKTSGSRADFNAYNSDVSTVGYIRFGAVTDNVGTDIQFANRPAGGSLTERLRITSAGNVGIGTSSPDAPMAIQRPSNNQGVSAGISLKGQDGTTQGGLGTDGVNDNAVQLVANQFIKFHTNNTDGTTNERMRLDSSGNLLIGTTSSSIYSTTTTGINLNPNGATSFNRASGQAAMFNRTSSDGDIVQWRRDGIVAGSIGSFDSGANIYIGSGDTGVTFNPTVNGILPHNPSTNAQLDNAIDLGYPTYRFKDGYFGGTVNADALSIDSYSDPTNNYITLRPSFAPSASGGVGFAAKDHDGANNDGLGVFGHDGISFTTGGSERMRLDSSGGVKINTTANVVTGYEQFSVNGTGGFKSGNTTTVAIWNTTTTNNGIQFFSGSGGTGVGSIALGASGTTYNTTSDIRLKEAIEPLVATDKLMQMNPVSYNWKSDPDGPRSMGFIAQQMQEVMPEAVSTGDDDDAMMSMDYGRITPILVSALQDAHRKIEELAAEIAELKAN